MEPFAQVGHSQQKYNTSSNFTDITNSYGEDEVRIVLLGKTGAGKSSAGNTLLGEEVFEATCHQNSQTKICQRHEKVISGRRFVIIDTPGVFDTERSEEDLRREIISSLVECAPGPHVFILVLAVERYTRENQEAVEKVLEYFSSDVLYHTVLLFTRGDDLDKDMTIHDFINKTDVQGKKSGKLTLKGLSEKCGYRVHVIDNRHWNKDTNAAPTLGNHAFENKHCEKDNDVLALIASMQKLNIPQHTIDNFLKEIKPNQADEIPELNILSDPEDNILTECQVESEEQIREYRSNRFQITQLMKSINQVLKEKNREPYKNETLEEIGEAIKEEVKNILQEMKDKGEIRDITEADMVKIRRQARERVCTRIDQLLAGVAVGTLLGALLGVGVGVAVPVVLVAGLIRAGWKRHFECTAGVGVGAAASAAAAAVIGAKIAGAASGVGAVVGAGACLLYGAMKGGASGYKASKISDNPKQAAKNAAHAVRNKAGDILSECWNVGSKTKTGDENEKLLKND